MNSKWHLYISLIKSAIRIIGVMFSVVFSQWMILALGLGIAEVLGVLEELKDEG